MFKELFEAKSIKITDLPKTISGGKYEDASFSEYNKKSGAYDYTQIDYDEFGDYGDEGEKYNQGYTLDCEVEIKDKKIILTTEVTDLGRVDQRAFNKKYTGLEFDNVADFVKKMQEIIKAFDKL